MKNQPHAQAAGIGDDRISVLGLTIKRKVAAALAAALLATLAFVFLFTGYLEGGAFVSMLTLAFGTGLVLLVWQRIEKFTLFGSEIKLRRLTQQAEGMLSGLDASRVDVYRTMLQLTGGTLEAHRQAGESQRESARATSFQLESIQALVGLLQSIEHAELIDRLAADVAKVTDKAIEQTTNSLRYQRGDFRQALDDTDIEQAPENIAEFYIRWAGENIRNDNAGLMAGFKDNPAGVVELQELLKYKEMAKADMHSV